MPLKDGTRCCFLQPAVLLLHFTAHIRALGLTAGISLPALAKGEFSIAELPQQDQEESRINTQIHSCHSLRKAFRALSALDCVTPLLFHLPTNTGTIRVQHNTQNRICSMQVPIIPLTALSFCTSSIIKFFDWVLLELRLWNKTPFPCCWPHPQAFPRAQTIPLSLLKPRYPGSWGVCQGQVSHEAIKHFQPPHSIL